MSMPSFEYPYDGEVITIKELNDKSYADFRPDKQWGERLKALDAANFTPIEVCVGLKEVTLEDNPIRYYMKLLDMSAAGRQDILAMRLGIMNAILTHAEDQLGLQSPAFSGRGGNRTLYKGEPFNTPNDGRIWATLPGVWRDSIGTSMNNPISYLYSRQHAHQSVENNGQAFAPMIAAFDTDKLELTDGNRADATSWRPRTGQTVLGSAACLYYFNPRHLTFDSSPH